MISFHSVSVTVTKQSLFLGSNDGTIVFNFYFYIESSGNYFNFDHTTILEEPMNRKFKLFVDSFIVALKE